jgi:hypothetical protein
MPRLSKLASPGAARKTAVPPVTSIVAAEAPAASPPAATAADNNTPSLNLRKRDAIAAPPLGSRPFPED